MKAKDAPRNRARSDTLPPLRRYSGALFRDTTARDDRSVRPMGDVQGVTRAYPSTLLRAVSLSSGDTPNLYREDLLERIRAPQAEIREDMKRTAMLEMEAREHDRRLDQLKAEMGSHYASGDKIEGSINRILRPKIHSGSNPREHLKLEHFFMSVE